MREANRNDITAHEVAGVLALVVVSLAFGSNNNKLWRPTATMTTIMIDNLLMLHDCSTLRRMVASVVVLKADDDDDYGGGMTMTKVTPNLID